MRRRAVLPLLLVLPLAGCPNSATGGAAEAPSLPAAAAPDRTPAVRAPGGCAQVADYTLGTMAEGEFDVSDCTSVDRPRRSVTDVYRIRTTERRDITAAVQAPALTVRLSLVGEDGVELAKDLFEGPFTRLSTQVPPGTYYLVLRNEVTDNTGNRLHGRYTLRTSTDQIGYAGCNQISPISLGSTVRGEWSVGDCVAPDPTPYNTEYQDYHLLTLPQTRNVTVVFDPRGADAGLRVFARDGTPVLGSAWGFEKTVSGQLPAGEYVINVGVSRASSRKTGPYVLSVR